MPKFSFISEFEEPAPIKSNYNSPQTWYNRYGGFIVETRWNANNRKFDTIYHPYDYPVTRYMPTE